MAITTAFKNGALDHILDGDVYHASTDVMKVVFHTQATDPASGTFPTIHSTQHAAIPFGAAASATISNSGVVEVANVQSSNWGGSSVTWISLHKCAGSGTTPSGTDLVISINVTDQAFNDGDTVRIAAGDVDVSIT